MNKQKVIERLHKQHPGKTIICLPEENPSEILCEVDPSSEHPDYSVAISIIDQSTPHVHKFTTEEYEVIWGSLTLDKDGKKFQLNEGDVITINPGEVHFAMGDETWIKATSHPGWTPEDHVLM